MPYAHLTPQERYCIAHMHMHKMSLRTIAKRLSRSPSTISREIKRNKPLNTVYWYETAEKFSQQRRSIPRSKKRKSHVPLYNLVVKTFDRDSHPN